MPILVQQNNTDDTPAIEPMVKIDLPQAETDSAEAVQTVAMSKSVDISLADASSLDPAASLGRRLAAHDVARDAGPLPRPGRPTRARGHRQGEVLRPVIQRAKFAFVIDNSGSMTKGRFETALYELQSAVEQMQPTQMFYVIFFNDTACTSLFHPEPALRLQLPGHAGATNRSSPCG